MTSPGWPITSWIGPDASSKSLHGFEPDAADWLMGHSWPGNGRELENVVQRAAVPGRGPRVSFRELQVDAAGADAEAGSPTLAQIEMRHIRQVLARTHGDKRQAARILGVSVRTLQRMEADSRDLRPDRTPPRR